MLDAKAELICVLAKMVGLALPSSPSGFEMRALRQPE